MPRLLPAVNLMYQCWAGHFATQDFLGCQAVANDLVTVASCVRLPCQLAMTVDLYESLPDLDFFFLFLPNATEKY